MASNLIATRGTVDPGCGQNADPSCLRTGSRFSLDDAREACPEGWRLPTRRDIADVIHALPGDPNESGGKVVTQEALAVLNPTFGGLSLQRGADRVLFGEGSQEVWFTSSDTTWVSEQDSTTVFRQVGLHIYPVSADSFHVEPTFSNPDRAMHAYCRCVRAD